MFGRTSPLFRFFVYSPPLSHAPTTIRYDTGISKALRMKPSAPALGTPPGLKGTKGLAVAPRDHLGLHLSACAVATRPGHLLTRLSLHGQGVRTIRGLEACHNLKVLV